MYSVELSVLLHRALEARVGALLDRLAVEHWEQEPEALHQVRVASRRMRAVLDLVDRELYPSYDRQARKVRKLTRALSRTRELDVHASLLEGLRPRLAGPGGGAALEHALEHLGHRARKARSSMLKDLKRLSLKGLPQLLEVPVMSNPFAPGNLELGTWTCLEPWLEGVLTAIPGLLDQEDAPALHALRIRVKRLRYSLEVLAPAFPANPEAQLNHLRGLQKALGGHHDLATLETFLQELHQGLLERARPVLAKGIRELIVLLCEERLCAFEQFRALAMGTPGEALRASLKRDLGLQPPLEGNPAP
jgi:CHAD domain-containing protein